MHAIRREIMILPLFAVRDYRRAGGFKPLNGVSNRIFIERSEVRILTVAFCNCLDEINGSWDTTNWLGRYTDRCSLSQNVIVIGWLHGDPRDDCLMASLYDGGLLSQGNH